MVLAHVDDKNGIFKALNGRTLEAFLKENSFNKIIALQKSGNIEHYEKTVSLTNRNLACVEGSDNAHGGISAIGAGTKFTYLKLGDYNFKALKYALLDKENRISPRTKPEIKNSYIKSIFQLPVYFGQKDLSNKDKDFEAGLVRKLIGTRLDELKREQKKVKSDIEDVVIKLNKLHNLEERKQDINAEIKDALYKLREYKEKVSISDNQFSEFKNRFYENLQQLLTFRVDDKFTIKYNEKPLKDHSLGQRATALILFLLAQKETNILIIDQPEDDLDNQTIYKDIIKQLKALKGNIQFIFATHNANIPVLGDSEKIISCSFSKDKIETHSGNIDVQDTQKEVVRIMEGGEEAFNRRKNIYEIWGKK